MKGAATVECIGIALLDEKLKECANKAAA